MARSRRHSPTEPRTITARQREELAVKLRLSGLTFEQIAKEVGYANRSSARKAVMRVLQREIEETREYARRLLREDLLRLEKMQAALWPRVIQGDVPSIKAILAIMERRARLLGLDTVGVEVSGPEGGPIPVTGEVHVYVPDNGRSRKEGEGGG